MPKCENCNRKGAFMKCKYCTKNYCTRCIQLEIHFCENIKDCIDFQKSLILKKDDISKVYVDYEGGSAC